MTMYADDRVISFSLNKTEETDVVVIAELACLEEWLQGNKLSLNIVKTHAMIIGSAQKLGQINKTSEITPASKLVWMISIVLMKLNILAL